MRKEEKAVLPSNEITYVKAETRDDERDRKGRDRDDCEWQPLAA